MPGGKGLTWGIIRGYDSGVWFGVWFAGTPKAFISAGNWALSLSLTGPAPLPTELTLTLATLGRLGMIPVWFRYDSGSSSSRSRSSSSSSRRSRSLLVSSRNFAPPYSTQCSLRSFTVQYGVTSRTVSSFTVCSLENTQCQTTTCWLSPSSELLQISSTQGEAGEVVSLAVGLWLVVNSSRVVFGIWKWPIGIASLTWQKNW